jgi:hypothetical protein
MSALAYSPAGFPRPTVRRVRRRGLGACVDSALQPVQGIAISDPNYRAASASNFANWLNWLQCTSPAGTSITLSAADQQLAQQFGIDTSNLSNSGRPGAYIPPSGPTATQPAGAPSPVSRVPATVQPVWGSTPAIVPVVATPSPTSTQPVGPASSSVGFLSTTFLGFPLWLWGAGVAAYFVFFSGGGHGR